MFKIRCNLYVLYRLFSLTEVVVMCVVGVDDKTENKIQFKSRDFVTLFDTIQIYSKL